ncbi:MAG TPA: adenylate cyclase regulatory domain-containing protein [Solirubrobacteraceae bacterium]|jgi:adenylate cyclase|nr:adenylate cyclase regulatory domain-containing protein [Solirubrobacteraceae bacterium]
MLANVAVIREDAAMDFDAAGLFAGLEGEDRAKRRRLLERLEADGFSEAELVKAVKENRLALLPVERVLGGTYTAGEVEERTGLPAGTMARLRRQHGLPAPESEDRVFSDEDVEAAKSMKLFLDAGFADERVDEITRVLGEGMGRLSATIAASFVETFLDAGESEDEVALRFAQLAEQLTPAFAPILVAAFKAHLRDSVQRGVLGLAELEAGDIAGAQELAVCFADLVGFTRLGGQVEVGELSTVAGRLASLSASLTEPPVRLVKTIGDAAMFVSPEPSTLVELALKLVDAFEAEGLPSLRAGIAFGPALLRAGDYYGNSVNLASRVTGVARPGSVLCTREIRDAASDAFSWSSAGRHKLKGVSGPTPLYRARHSGEGA